MASLGEPVLLAKNGTLQVPTRAYLLRFQASVDTIIAFGGPTSIPSTTFRKALTAAGTQTTYYGPDTQP